MLPCLVIGVLTLQWRHVEGAITSGLPRARRAASRHAWSCPFAQRDISCQAYKAAMADWSRGKVGICLWDPNTAHHPAQLSAVNVAPMIEWIRNCSTTDATLFVLSSVKDADFAVRCCGRDTYSLFYTIEPPEIDPAVMPYLSANNHHYDYSLTVADPEHDGKQLQHAMTWPYGSSWIPAAQWGMHPKTKLCSIIASSKTMAPGHKLRHEVVKMLNAEFEGLCDIVGRGYAPLDNKADGLQDYMFSIVIENSINGRWMTEKIIDSMAVGTVPLYWGPREAERVFAGGIIPWRSLDELRRALGTLDARLYKRMRAAARANLNKARAYETPERWLWDHVFACGYEWHASHPPPNCA